VPATVVAVAVRIDLDASRRWVGLRDVHPAFAGAVGRVRPRR